MRRASAALLLVVVVAACSSEPARTAPETVVDRAGAPPITSPRELSSRAVDPCRSLLTSGQVRRLGYDLPGESRVDNLGAPACTWREEDKGRTTIVSVVLTRDLFVDTYRNRLLPIFRPLRIDDLPAVDIKSGPQVQTCTTTVGVADGQSLDLDTSVGGGRDGIPDGDPCAEGHRVAEAIVSTLPRR